MRVANLTGKSRLIRAVSAGLPTIKKCNICKLLECCFDLQAPLRGATSNNSCCCLDAIIQAAGMQHPQPFQTPKCLAACHVVAHVQMQSVYQSSLKSFSSWTRYCPVLAIQSSSIVEATLCIVRMPRSKLAGKTRPRGARQVRRTSCELLDPDKDPRNSGHFAQTQQSNTPF